MDLKKEINLNKEEKKNRIWGYFKWLLIGFIGGLILFSTIYFVFDDIKKEKNIKQHSITIDQQNTMKSEIKTPVRSVPIIKTIKPGDLLLTVQDRNILKEKVPFVTDKLYLYFGGFVVGSNENDAHFTIKAYGTDAYSDQNVYSEEFSFINVSKGDTITVPLTNIKLVVKDIDVQKNSLTLERAQ